MLQLLYDFLSLENDVKVASKSNKQKIYIKKLTVAILKVTDEIAGSGSGSVSLRYGSVRLRYRSAVPKCDGTPALLNLFMINKGHAERVGRAAFEKKITR